MKYMKRMNGKCGVENVAKLENNYQNLASSMESNERNHDINGDDFVGL